MNFQMSISREDKVRALVLALQGTAGATDLEFNHTTNDVNRASAILLPRLCIKRITVVLGQQQIVINSTKQGDIEELNLSDVPFAH